MEGFRRLRRHVIVDAPVESEPTALQLATRSRDVAFVELADAHLDASYRLATAILGDRADAEDATHDALVTAWRRWNQLRDPDRFEPWFRRILVNTCRDRLRRRARHQTSDLSDELASLADPTAGIADRDQIGRAMARLSADHRIVVVLRFLADLPIDEIARLVGVPSGTVNSRLHRALRELRQGVDR